ncbi:BREX-6 system phosphatase PglZ [Rhodopirellula sp. SWK7]|uniref:BREX-6 system phosphatase PglZ n=1 Tax=Rhodopirellula sp. SWK7 TaxID=595460 RepID=UPI0002BE0556|nr:BREX-6 system phosphatase PglZ [Rhodopirellula sp. SWK7]EMI44535.1 PglZ domain protein [Rhodopirellula sp. SWK7]
MTDTITPARRHGPVSKALESELRALIGQHDIVIWLDAGSIYTDFVDSLARMQADGKLPYAVHAFRGSHLQLLFDLRMVSSSPSRHPMVIHMPGFNRDSVKQTPILELYLAGRSFEKRFSTLVTDAATGNVTPEQIKAFLSDGETSIAAADEWLTDMLRSGGNSIAAQLHSLSAESLLDDLLSSSPMPDSVADRVDDGADLKPLWNRLGATLGLPGDWRTDLLRESQRDESQIGPKDIAFVAAAWAMAVEYVDDLDRDPVDPRLNDASTLATPLKQACRSLACYLRTNHVKFYLRTSNDAENFLEVEKIAARAEDLGKVDTFEFEEQKIFEGTLEAIKEEKWDVARTWADRRLSGDSFWLQEDPQRESSWRLLLSAAVLGESIEKAGATLGEFHSLTEAIDIYIAKGAAVDRAHRQMEQQRRSLLFPSLPRYYDVRQPLDAMRLLWRDWADAWAIEFNQFCQTHGFLPKPEYRQRDFFDDVVVPLCKDGDAVAVFAVDAFRFEMATELMDEFESAKATTVHLNGRLAELPTVTSVGMNALAPVNQKGKMKPDVKNGSVRSFHSGQFQVKDPASRKRAMHEKVGGRTCPMLTLQEISGLDGKQLRRKIAGAKLIYVHSQEIDDAGEKDLGPVVFDYAMQSIRAAWQLLREAGVKQFVLTADHGFLLRDGLSEVQSHGRKVDPRRRHVLRPPSADHEGEARVPLSDLGYEGCDQHLFFPMGTAAFDIGNKSLNYLHGGNSLQERLIPVITISHRAAVGGQNERYEFTDVKREEAVAEMHCVTATLTHVSEQASLGFSEGLKLAAALRPLGADDVSLELVQVRGGGAKLKSGTIVATAGTPFEVFFRLKGKSDGRVRVELYHPAADADVTPLLLPDRFTVTVVGGVEAKSEPEIEKTPAKPIVDEIEASSWLHELENDEVRQFFNHLEKHGTVTADEAETLLGGPRQARRFSSKFEAFAAKAPFAARIDVIGGVKRYVREHETEYKIIKDSESS